MPRNPARAIDPVLGIATALSIDGDDLDWHARAACAGRVEEAPALGWDGWFPSERFTRAQREAEEAAKDVCWRLCSARSECLDAALVNSEPFGVWGGLTPTERQRLTRGGVA
jgi:WhiB family transcriptional regulator, redox-sensing transcriptional regulator